MIYVNSIQTIIIVMYLIFETSALRKKFLIKVIDHAITTVLWIKYYIEALLEPERWKFTLLITILWFINAVLVFSRMCTENENEKEKG